MMMCNIQKASFSLWRGWVEDHTLCVVFVYTTFVLYSPSDIYAGLLDPASCFLTFAMACTLSPLCCTGVWDSAQQAMDWWERHKGKGSFFPWNKCIPCSALRSLVHGSPDQHVWNTECCHGGCLCRSGSGHSQLLPRGYKGCPSVAITAQCSHKNAFIFHQSLQSWIKTYVNITLS